MHAALPELVGDVHQLPEGGRCVLALRRGHETVPAAEVAASGDGPLRPAVVVHRVASVDLIGREHLPKDGLPDDLAGKKLLQHLPVPLRHLPGRQLPDAVAGNEHTVLVLGKEERLASSHVQKAGREVAVPTQAVPLV